MISSFSEERYPNPSKCDSVVVGKVSLKDLETSLTEIVHSQDGHKLGSDSISSQSSESTESSKKAAFAGGLNGEDEEDEDEEEEEEEEEEEDLTALVLSGYDGYNSKSSESYSSKPSHRKPVPIPSADNLVPAIKGSRAKLGKPKKNRRVTWAPGVYDPPPSASTIVRHKQPKLKSESKKNFDTKKNGGKNKQQPKGKAVKKQAKGSKWRSNRDDDSD